jgi:hypothetical protein
MHGPIKAGHSERWERVERKATNHATVLRGVRGCISRACGVWWHHGKWTSIDPEKEEFAYAWQDHEQQ